MSFPRKGLQGPGEIPVPAREVTGSLGSRGIPAMAEAPDQEAQCPGPEPGVPGREKVPLLCCVER